MILRNVYVRFYKSFNYDYLRKNDPKVTRRMPWENLDDGTWYPHVRVPIEETITTVVGANEAGKTHLLSAISKGITGRGIERLDFCRYSRFFTVEKDKMRWPGFGFEWRDLSAEDRNAVLQACGLTSSVGDFDHFLFFRENKEKLTIYLAEGGDKYAEHPVTKPDALLARLPNVFQIDASVALPDSVLIKQLTREDQSTKASKLARQERFGLLDSLEISWFKDAQTLTKAAQPIVERLGPWLKPAGNGATIDDRQLRLTRDLFHKVARIDPEAFAELYGALSKGEEGFANGLVQRINDCLERELNFPRWWVQDKDFNLQLSLREFELVLTIRDRTGTDYLFRERSSGLKYFLSYYVQYRAHSPADNRPEILLMDEPDAYLSAQAQQDLLKIFDAFASPDDGRPPVQVVYVTHSPFLIDRNHAERIRVLDKGRSDEGTRVVRDASRNHYEPLRSSLGAFVGETTFIGNCNLMVEGLADQILLAGAAKHLRTRGTAESETLDLNRVTIVPCGSASHIPYLVYLARGRDIDRPAVMVLLDSDDAGNEARRKLDKGGPKGQVQLLKSDYVLQVGDLSAVLKPARAFRETEDLLPLGLCVRAARRYIVEFCGVAEGVAQQLTEQHLQDALASGAAPSSFKAVETALAGLPGSPHIEKVGFARTILDELPQASEGDRHAFEGNMRALFSELNSRRRAAERELAGASISRRIERAKKSLLADYPHSITRDRAREILEDMEAVLDDSVEADVVRSALQTLRREFRLSQDLALPVDDYPRFRAMVEQLTYVGRIATQDPLVVS